MEGVCVHSTGLTGWQSLRNKRAHAGASAPPRQSLARDTTRGGSSSETLRRRPQGKGRGAARLPQRLYVVRQHASIVVLPELDDRVPIDRDRSSSRTIISSSFRGTQRLAEAPKPLHDVCSGSVYAQAPAGSGVA